MSNVQMFMTLPLNQDGRVVMISLDHLESVKDMFVGGNGKISHTRYRMASGQEIESTKSLDEFLRELNGGWNPNVTVE